MIEQAQRADADLAGLPQRPAGAFLRGTLRALTRSHKVLPMNSGAEAVESALKLARKWGYEVKGVPDDQAEIIVCADNFHGRTLTIVGFSHRSGVATRISARSRRASVVPVRRRRGAGGGDHAQHRRLPGRADPGRGRRHHPAGRLSARRRARSARAHDVLLILDEIQTGLGRTGKLLAEEHEGVEADLTLIGKALSGGFYPVSAVLSNIEVLGVLKPGEHGSTFGGNPLACAVARMALRCWSRKA